MTLQNYNLIGAGGTGSFLLPALLKYLATHHTDDWHVQIIDGDHYSVANLDRQLFDSRFVDENKASALVTAYDNGRLNAVDQYLGPDNIEELILEGDINLVAADNYTVRAHLDRHVASLSNGAIINGGNEVLDGSCQIYWRHNNRNATPRLSHLHPEIKINPGEDRSEMDCLAASQLPGGGQTVIANMMSAVTMLNALRMLHEYMPGGVHSEITIHELHFDLITGRMKPADWRGVEGWK